MLPKVAITVLNWNGWRDTIDLLESINRATYEPLLVIVIDNGSTDDLSVTKIKEWLSINYVIHTSYVFHTHSLPDTIQLSTSWESGKHYLFIESKYNLGFCVGNNVGMECGTKLGANYSLILNNDTLVSPNFLEPMVEIAENDSQVGLVGGVITYCNNPDTIWWAGGKFDRFLNATRLHDSQPIGELPAQTAFETDWISGCMMLIPLHIYKKFGGYAEEYFIWSEEWDYSLLVKQAGFHHMVAKESQICHKIGRSLGVMKPLNYYYGLRNGLLFKRKYLSPYIWYPYLIYYLINRVLRFIQLAIQGRMDLVKAGISAIIDFLAGRAGVWKQQIL